MDRVRISVVDGVFEGSVHPDSTHDRIILSDAELCSTGKKSGRLLTFFDNEITSIEYINETNDKDTEQDNTSSAKPSSANMCNGKPRSRVSNGSDAKSDNNSFLDNINELNVVIIDELNENFNRAIAFIKQQKIIGVAVEGILVGRRGKLCWLQIRAGDFVYLFDMLHFASKFCDGGIKDILENSELLKIMHDCRLPSDALFHKFGIKLTNIFDTQVADILIRRMDKRSLPTRVRSLSNCADEYLNLSSGVIRYAKRNDDMFDEERQMIWKERPISREMMQLAIHNVAYLRDLRMEMMQRLLSEFEMGVDVYLGQVRDNKDEEIVVIRPELVPDDFKLLSEKSRQARSSRLLASHRKFSTIKSTIPPYFNLEEPASFKLSPHDIKKSSAERSFQFSTNYVRKSSAGRSSFQSSTNCAGKSSADRHLSTDDEKPVSDISPISSEDSFIDRGTNNYSASSSVPWATTSADSRTKSHPPAGFRQPGVRKSLIR